MMKSFKRTLLGALALTLLIPAAGFAQSSATATADALANIIQPIAIVNDAALNFGDIVADAVGGTVVVSTAGLATSGTLTLLGGESAAAFTVTGAAGRTFDVTSDLNTTISELGGSTMTVDTFSFSCDPCTIGDPLTVGGTLTVGANQVAGAYSGTFDVTVSYQ